MKSSPETSTSDTAHLAQPETIFMKPNTNLLTPPNEAQFQAVHTPTNLTLVDEPPRQADSLGRRVIVLTAEDREYLATRERRVTGSVKASIAAAKALHEVSVYKGGVLWRETHKTIYDYCRDKWHFGRAHTHRLLTCGKIIQEIEARATDQASPNGDVTPVSETHLRPLLKLGRDKQVDCWLAIVAKTKPADLTEKIVAAETESYAASRDVPIESSYSEPPSAKAKATACLEKLRTAVKPLPIAAEIEVLLSQVEVLLTSVVDRTLTDDKASPTSDSMQHEVDQEAAAGFPLAVQPEASATLASVH